MSDSACDNASDRQVAHSPCKIVLSFGIRFLVVVFSLIAFRIIKVKLPQVLPVRVAPVFFNKKVPAGFLCYACCSSSLLHQHGQNAYFNIF